MSDIHGEFIMFEKMLKKINFSNKDELYILGDVVDRGCQPIKLIKYIMEHENIFLIRGNHEQMMLDGLTYYQNEYVSTLKSRLWLNNGGFVTVDQFLDLPKKEQKEIYNFIKNTPLYKIIDKNILVHAGLEMYKYSFKDDKELEEFLKKNSKNALLWDRDMVYNPEFEIDDYHIWVGHTPTLMLKESPTEYETNGFTLIDGGACFNGGILICVCLDNNQKFYIYRHEIS